MKNNGMNVLITGASSGIGYELAKIFAAEGYNLILVARRKERLKLLQEDLQMKYRCKVIVINMDLSAEYSAEKLYDHIIELNIEIDILINNAGIGYCGLFNSIKIDKHKETINLNIVFLTNLTYLISCQMIKKKKGIILNVASTGAYEPGPLINVYYATKAYVLSFSEALYNELKPYNILVSTFCPGTTSTEFNTKSGKGELSNAMSAEKVARIGYNGLMHGKRVIIPGTMNKFLVLMCKILPRKVLASTVKKIQRHAIEKYNIS